MLTLASRVLALAETAVNGDFATHPLPESSSNLAIAQTIHKQLMATDKWALARVGANQFVALDNGLQFKVKGPKVKVGGRIQISLNSKDLYDVRLLRVRGADVKEVASSSDIYFDALAGILDRMVG